MLRQSMVPHENQPKQEHPTIDMDETPKSNEPK